jgi:hypothetical protein
MRKTSFAIAIMATLLTSTVFADNVGDLAEGKSCAKIAKACVDGGFARRDGGKKFWQGCMKPLLLGETVKGAKVDAEDVSACRTQKIDKMTQELNELQNAAKKS